MMKALAFDDVLLVPRKSNISSRLAVDTSTVVGGINLRIPIISSPMDTITESKMATTIGQLGGLGLIHRMCSVEEQIEFLRIPISTGNPVGFAVGVGADEESRFSRIYNEYRESLHLVCIDIANGHNSIIKKAIEYIRDIAPNISIMAGNVATADGYTFLADLGVNSVRVGIGGGSICSTRIQTGFGVPTLTSVMLAAKVKQDGISIIADGGIRYPGDITKSLAAGADAVICGNILAATTESPGSVFYEDGLYYKKYRGMASAEIQIEKRGGLKKGTCAEGTATLIRYKGGVAEIIDNFIGGLCSGLTLNGSPNIKSLQDEHEFIEITDSGIKESHSHGTR